MDNNQIKKIPLYMVDEPVNAMRGDVWDSDLDDLARSIEQFGLMQPVIVSRKSAHTGQSDQPACQNFTDKGYCEHDRFEIVAGHRRLAAHRKLGLQTIDAIERVVDETTNDAMKIHENLYRASVNPVDEAVFLAQYQERSKLSLSELARMVNRSEAWVQTRLDILTYPDYLIEFVHEGKLSMATASILNKIVHPKIKESYCRTASIQGLSATRAKYWLDQANVGTVDPDAINIETPTEYAGSSEPVVVKMRCAIDGQEYDVNYLQNVFVLPENLRTVRENIEVVLPSNEPQADENTT